MSSLQVIENILSGIQKYLAILERYGPYSREDIEGNIDVRGALERYLYLVIQSVIDCAEAVIAYKKLRKPTTISDAFYILEEAGVLSSDELEPYIHMTGFRNVLAHGYERVDYDVVYDVLHGKLADVTRFIEKVRDYCRM